MSAVHLPNWKYYVGVDTLGDTDTVCLMRYDPATQMMEMLSSDRYLREPLDGAETRRQWIPKFTGEPPLASLPLKPAYHPSRESE